MPDKNQKEYLTRIMPTKRITAEFKTKSFDELEQMLVQLSKPDAVPTEAELVSESVATSSLLLLESLSFEMVSEDQWSYAFDRAIRRAIENGMTKEECRKVFGHIRQAIFAARGRNLFDDFIG